MLLIHFNWNFVFCIFFKFFSEQRVKAAILEDMVQLGREGGLKTFEQVHRLWSCLSFQIAVIVIVIDWG